MTSPYEIIEFATQLELFAKHVAQDAVHGQSFAEQLEHEQAYNAAIYGEAYENLSFYIRDSKDDNAQALVLAHKIEGEIRYNHLGVSIVPSSDDKKLIRAALEHLIETAKQKKATLFVDDRYQCAELSSIGAECFNHQGIPNTKLEAIVDLSASEDEIRRNLRKSYRSLVNNGRRDMEFKYIRGSEISRDVFDSFREFHREVAGRTTRSIETWDAQYEMVKAGHAELILGYMEQHGLVSSALFNDMGQQTIYSVAVYNRDLFDMPLAHANVYEGILRAKARGQKEFYLGQIPPFGTVEEKEYNIGKFKKGFCDRLRSYIEWRIEI